MGEQAEKLSVKQSIIRVATIHELKTWPPFFQAMLDGVKSFEIREDDRDFQVGDALYLREFDPYKRERLSDGQYTNRKMYRLIVYKLDSSGFAGIKKGFCALGLGVLPYHARIEIVRDVIRPA